MGYNMFGNINKVEKLLRYASQIMFLFLLVLLFSCSSERSPTDRQISALNQFPKYAKGFKVNQLEAYTEVLIFDPYMQDKLMQRILIPKDSSQQHEGIPQYPDLIIHNPEKIVALSATQWGLFLKLGLAHKIKGISEARFVQNKQMNKLLESGSVIEIAADASFKIELLAMLHPDLILVSPDANGLPKQLLQLGFPILSWPDYFETDPLGRAEWIRLAGLISGKSVLADSLFFDMEAAYLRLKKLVLQHDFSKPTIFSDKIFAGQWYVPAGESYMANIFKDAGADYVFAGYAGKASIPLDIETIISKAARADYWRIAQAASSYTYKDLNDEYDLYAGFEAFKNRKVIFCNTAQTAYFEESPMHPHWVLADFIAIFHPEIMPDHQAVYHKLLR